MSKPEEHILWALVHLPAVGGAPQIAHVDTLRAWSKHLYQAGFRHQPDEQKIKYRRPVRGPQTQFNGASAWVEMDTPEPNTPVIPDIRGFTTEENLAMLAQYERAGMLPAPLPQQDVAEELN